MGNRKGKKRNIVIKCVSKGEFGERKRKLFHFSAKSVQNV